MNSEVFTKSGNWKSSYLALVGLLFRRRKELGISQEDLAARLKAGRRSFQRWEDGRAAPSGKRLFQWASALGVEIAPQVAQSHAEEGLTADVEKTIRRVTRQGVRVQGTFFSSPILADLVGHDLVVEVPEGPLPETLSAAYGARLLTLRSIQG